MLLEGAQSYGSMGTGVRSRVIGQSGIMLKNWLISDLKILGELLLSLICLGNALNNLGPIYLKECDLCVWKNLPIFLVLHKVPDFLVYSHESPQFWACPFNIFHV